MDIKREKVTVESITYIIEKKNIIFFFILHTEV